MALVIGCRRLVLDQYSYSRARTAEHHINSCRWMSVLLDRLVGWKQDRDSTMVRCKSSGASGVMCTQKETGVGAAQATAAADKTAREVDSPFLCAAAMRASRFHKSSIQPEQLDVRYDWPQAAVCRPARKINSDTSSSFYYCCYW
ncbi:hypothetical protein CBL_05869 [Carabus blaptoides fortunei]